MEPAKVVNDPLEIQVGIADYKIGKDPARLITLGLGSCVGVSLYDPVLKLGGLLHLMLPDSTQFNN
ncbi:chemotaxis protein CheD, partial [Desulfofundulus sp.]|uniref:chemotaxis protein CheD n=1 Tax=Desulfofundulus sp. TaxID=2282750 RepID=UPI003C7120AC